MFSKILQSTNLSQLKSLASPAFFDVLPSRLLWSEGRRLLGHYRDQPGFTTAVRDRRVLASEQLPWLELSLEGPSSGPLPEVPLVYAEQVLQLYFHQIVSGDAVLLDLRADALWPRPEGLRWRPASLWTRWDAGFSRALREVYRGFYEADDAAFERGLGRLGLAEAAPLFREHFGADPSDTHFELTHFLESFQAIFEFCKQRGVELDPGFLSFGIYLATLYENLDRLPIGGVDVRRCYELATGARPREQAIVA